jgi:RNA polymerase sigma-70 factor (ECF subfamily)
MDPLRDAATAWPSIHLNAGVFEAHVRARGEPEELELEDLYLACACLHGDARALQLFDAQVLPRIDAVVRRYDASDTFVDEVRQTLREKLFLPPPRIAEYQGQGPLVAWLRAAAARTALNLMRPEKRAALVETDALEVLPFAAPDPDLQLLRGRHRSTFRAAFQKALEALPVRERTALKLNALDGVSLEKIGAMYGKDKSTVSRWLAHAQDTLLEETKANLKAALGLESAEVESLVAALKSQLASSLVHLLSE